MRSGREGRGISRFCWAWISIWSVRGGCQSEPGRYPSKTMLEVAVRAMIGLFRVRIGNAHSSSRVGQERRGRHQADRGICLAALDSYLPTASVAVFDHSGTWDGSKINIIWPMGDSRSPRCRFRFFGLAGQADCASVADKPARRLPDMLTTIGIEGALRLLQPKRRASQVEIQTVLAEAIHVLGRDPNSERGPGPKTSFNSPGLAALSHSPACNGCLFPG
jgi:hypothetical protein